MRGTAGRTVSALHVDCEPEVEKEGPGGHRSSVDSRSFCTGAGRSSTRGVEKCRGGEGNGRRRMCGKRERVLVSGEQRKEARNARCSSAGELHVGRTSQYMLNVGSQGSLWCIEVCVGWRGAEPWEQRATLA